MAIADLTSSGLETLALPPANELVSYRWAGNGKVLLVMGRNMPWADKGDTYVTRTFSYDLASGKLFSLGPQDITEYGSGIIWVDPAGKSMLLAAQADPYHYPTIYRVDLATGHAKVEQTPYDNVWSWYADRDGVLRVGFGYQLDTWFMMYRTSGKEGYRKSPSFSYRADVPGNFWMIPGTDEGYAFANKDGRDALFRYNFSTRALGALIYANATNDVDDADFDETTGEPISVSYTEDRDRLFWFDSAQRAQQTNLEKTFGGGRAVVTISNSRDHKRSIIWAGSATDPGAYYLIDNEMGGIRRLAKIAEGVDRAALSETKYVHYAARDGTDIPAYLTLPKGREPKNLPLIIMPHGGPYGARDSLEYHNEVQFLANRGYIVLQPNYRGSSGYGRDFAGKGAGQWGRAMQNDIDDGMDWLVKQGVVDAKRVCIVGGSYGGYVALWGATRNPERYRCAVSFAGISDLKAQLAYQSDFFSAHGTSRRDWQSQVRGDKNFDLLSVSPISKAASLKVPVMLVHGDADTRVPPKQTTLYDKALTAAGIVHETYIYPGAGHGFDKAADEKSYLDRLEAFLTKYNPS